MEGAAQSSGTLGESASHVQGASRTGAVATKPMPSQQETGAVVVVPLSQVPEATMQKIRASALALQGGAVPVAAASNTYKSPLAGRAGSSKASTIVPESVPSDDEAFHSSGSMGFTRTYMRSKSPSSFTKTFADSGSVHEQQDSIENAHEQQGFIGESIENAHDYSLLTEGMTPEDPTADLACLLWIPRATLEAKKRTNGHRRRRCSDPGFSWSFPSSPGGPEIIKWSSEGDEHMSR